MANEGGSDVKFEETDIQLIHRWKAHDDLIN